MRFLVDTQLPKAVARMLSEAGHQAEHVLDLDLAQSPDSALWNDAQREGAAIISKDEDFAQWVLTGRPGPLVVWLRIGNCTHAELIAWLQPALPEVCSALENGDRLVEVW